MIFLLILSILGATATVSTAQVSDRRTYTVSTHSRPPVVASVYLQLADDLPGAADRSSRIAVFQLAESLYLRVIPQRDRNVRGVPAYLFQLARDADGKSVLLPTNQPMHGVTEDLLRAADFRNSDNSGPNETGPKNVNAAEEFRDIEFADYMLEIRPDPNIFTIVRPGHDQNARTPVRHALSPEP